MKSVRPTLAWDYTSLTHLASIPCIVVNIPQSVKSYGATAQQVFAGWVCALASIRAESDASRRGHKESEYGLHRFLCLAWRLSDLQLSSPNGSSHLP